MPATYLLVDTPRETSTARMQHRKWLKQRIIAAAVALLVSFFVLRGSNPSAARSPAAPVNQPLLQAPETETLDDQPNAADVPRAAVVTSVSAASVGTPVPSVADTAASEIVDPPSDVPPLVSLYSAFTDRFVRVDDEGVLHADADYPWSEACWFRVLRLSTNLSLAPQPAVKTSPSTVSALRRLGGCEDTGCDDSVSAGRRLGSKSVPASGDGAVDAALASAAIGGGREGGRAAGGEDVRALPQLDTQAEDGAAAEAETETREELWAADALGDGWFALVSELNNKLVRLYGADAGANGVWLPSLQPSHVRVRPSSKQLELLSPMCLPNPSPSPMPNPKFNPNPNPPNPNRNPTSGSRRSSLGSSR